MQHFFLGMTLGNDPHTVGIYSASRIARMAGIDSHIVPPSTTDDEKIKLILEYNPKFIGLSYRLSADKAVELLSGFLGKMRNAGLLDEYGRRRICFAGLRPTIERVHESGLDKDYRIFLMGSKSDVAGTTIDTLDYFDVQRETVRQGILNVVLKEVEPKRIEILDHLADEVIMNDGYWDEPPLSTPSEDAIRFLPTRIAESPFPVIRSHFGIPHDTIMPTVEGIERIAEARVVDEISLGSSDLSQRYFGNPSMFKVLKNDGGVPYKTKGDLSSLYLATRRGNFPSIKPYCHVFNIKSFVDDCLETGMLVGAHQAVPLYWFSELDGRGPLSVSEAIEEHIETVEYLASKNIPVEMNDPNHWSSRFAHDTIVVSDYALIASVMFNADVQHMILQCQFNKPAVTGDYADLAKMTAVKQLVECLRPKRNRTRIYLETRAGIEHFSIDLSLAKRQLARTTLLQMLLKPSIIHLVSYCEADHAATVEDIIESSKIIRRAMRLFNENKDDIVKSSECPFVHERREYLLKEAEFLIRQIARQHSDYNNNELSELYKFLANPSVLLGAIDKGFMAAPGIVHPKYQQSSMLTRPSDYGAIDSFLNWDDKSPMKERERLARLGLSVE